MSVELARHLPLKQIRACRLDWILATLLATVALVFSLLLVSPFLSDYGDNARYMILAKSLATGQGFTLISEPGSPPDRLYPYGYPALLALPMLFLGGDHRLAEMVTPLKMPSVVLFAGSILLAYALAAEWHSRSVALLGSLLAALNPLALRFSSDVMSEIPFLFFSLVAIALLQRAARDQRSSWKYALAATALAGAFYIRTIGIALIAAGLTYLLLRCGIRKCLFVALLLSILLIPWFHQQLSVNTEVSYWTQFSASYAAETQVEEGPVQAQWLRLVARPLNNLRGYVSHKIPSALFPHLSQLTKLSPFPAIGLAKASILLLIAIGWVEGLRSGSRIAALYTAISVLSLSPWWEIDRFLVPLVPFLSLYLLVGLRRLASSVGVFVRLKPGLLLPVFSLPFIISYLLWDGSNISLNLANLAARTPGEYYAEIMPDYANYYRAAEWLRTNSPRGAVVMGVKPYLLYVCSDRTTVAPLRSGTPEDVMGSIQSAGISYVVEDSIVWNASTSMLTSSIIRAFKSGFALEYETPEPLARVWRYVGPVE